MVARMLCLASLFAVLGLALAADPPKTPPKLKVPSPIEGRDNSADPKDPRFKGKNLILNGGFEEGDETPRHWQSVDGLSTFYVRDEDPARGKVIKFDTDVTQKQAYEWWPKIARGQATAKDAPPKALTVEPKYDTLAGLDGVWYWSDPVPVERDKSYWLTVDAKGPAMYVWLIGYRDKPTTEFGADNGAFQDVLKAFDTGKPVKKERGFEQFIHKYEWKGQLVIGGSDQWKTYARRAKPFRPTANTPRVRWVRVMLYPFWPPGEYFVDNVRLVEFDEEAGEKSAK